MAFFNRTRIFTVFLKPTDRHIAETAQFVEDGFSFPAFVFGWLWALYHRIWWVAAAQFLTLALLSALVENGSISSALNLAVQTAIQLFIALEAPNLRARALIKRGYALSDVVAEDSLLHAQQRYFARHASVMA